MHNIRQYEVPLQRYMAMMDLQVLILMISGVFSFGYSVEVFVDI